MTLYNYVEMYPPMTQNVIRSSTETWDLVKWNHAYRIDIIIHFTELLIHDEPNLGLLLPHRWFYPVVYDENMKRGYTVCTFFSSN